MQISSYTPNDINWLKGRFSNIKLGWLKASEMEIYLAYMLMYAENDLDKRAYEIADKYGYSESKVAKLQVEFARRFKEEEAEEVFLLRIFDSMLNFGGDHRVIPIIDQNVISFTLYDAADARRLRNIISSKGMMSISDSSKLVFKLTPPVFASLFADCRKDFKGRLKTELIKANTTENDLKKLFKTKSEEWICYLKNKGLSIAENILCNAVGEALKSYFR